VQIEVRRVSHELSWVVAAALVILFGIQGAACDGRPARSASTPTPSASHSARIPPKPPPPVLGPKECPSERQSLAKREATLTTSPHCLEVLRKESDLGFLKRITLTSYEQTSPPDIALIARATALEDLSLSLVPIPVLDELASLASLRSVWISTPVSNLDAVRELAQLERLVIAPPGHGELKDLSALSGLSRLSTLSVREIIALPALAQVRPNLTTLVAPLATGLSALSSFPELRALTLGCFASKTERVPVPPKLRELRIECHDQPLPLDPIAKFTELTQLDISETDPLSLDPLTRLGKLERLDAHDSKLKNVAPLAKCTALTWVDLHGTQVSNLDPLATLPRLESIDAGNTPVSDVTALSRSHSLQSLWLPGTSVTNVLPLGAVRTLRELMVPKSCSRADSVALHKSRPDLRIMEWLDKSEAEDPTCFH
jgi:Leucine-rich repeat (LRR) protein